MRQPCIRRGMRDCHGAAVMIPFRVPDILQEYKAARAAILKERERMSKRFQEIEQALHQIGALPSTR